MCFLELDHERSKNNERIFIISITTILSVSSASHFTAGPTNYSREFILSMSWIIVDRGDSCVGCMLVFGEKK